MKKILLAMLIILLVSPVAHSTITVYSGIDAGGTSVGPNSLAARNSFDASTGLLSTIDFESLAVGTLELDPYTPVAIASGVSANFFGDMDNSLTWPLLGVQNGSDAILGFNTTAGGANYLGFMSDFEPLNTPGLSMTFANPVNAWGAYLTGLEPNIAGVLHVLFNDGSVHDLTIPDGAIGGGSSFYGFTTDGSVSALNFELHGVSGTRDIFGFDDVVYASVPEPSTLLLLGSGLAGIAVLRKRLGRREG